MREKQQSAASYTRPDQRLNPQPRHVPWVGIEPATQPTEPHWPGLITPLKAMSPSPVTFKDTRGWDFSIRTWGCGEPIPPGEADTAGVGTLL